MRGFHSAASVGVFMVLLGSLVPPLVHARGFLVHRVNSIRNGTQSRILASELSNAMGEVLGCGGHISQDELLLIEGKLAPMWRSLPKNVAGNVERRSLRYVVHRYFNRQSSLHIRGFEPSRPLNASSWGNDDILGQRVPAFVESVLESQHKLLRGFTRSDAAHMIATIEQLILDGEGALLEQVYKDLGVPTAKSLNHEDLCKLLESYAVRWLLRVDGDTAASLLSDKKGILDSVPQWDEVSTFLSGRIRLLEFIRRQEPVAALADASARRGHNALSSRYSSDDVHSIVGGITKSFAAFWDSECASMKASLFNMDTHRTGRVPLSRFYSNGLETDWRFGESESYLRELGALDETGWRGKQVLVSNYMQAASNCVISTSHYLVCCVNDCEVLLDEIETALGSPAVLPAKLFAVVGNMSSQSTLDDDAALHLDASFAKQLEQIAAVHNGEVPLHGRLFAQWLHYVFPRECAFPYKVGTVASVTPAEYGDDFYASAAEMAKHASGANATQIPQTAGKEELQWMSQWSPDEELVSEHAAALSLQAPWEGNYTFSGIVLLAFAGLVGLGGLSHRGLLGSSTPRGPEVKNKGHLV